MQIFVRGCLGYGGNAYTIEVESSDSIAQVKEKISNKTGIFVIMDYYKKIFSSI